MVTFSTTPQSVSLAITALALHGSHDAALEFAANIGPWQLKGIDLIRFNEAGEMVEFEVMVRPIKALQALGEEMGRRIGPQLALLKQQSAPPV